MDQHEPPPAVSHEAKATNINTELLTIGNLRVHFLPFDHVNAGTDLPQALTAFQALRSQHPGAIPILEYLPPEIRNEQGQGSPFELANILASYEPFLSQAGIDRVLVVDPAYNNKFGIPEFLPLVLPDIPPAVFLGKLLFSRRPTVEDKPKSGEKTAQKVLTRRDVLRKGSIGVAMTLGIITAENEQRVIATGVTKDDPVDLPGALISERDFRILTIAHALEKLSTMTESLQAQDMILIYPPSHLARIQEIFTAGGVAKTLGSLKFDIYKLMYGWLDILNIREWSLRDSHWDRTKEIPVDYAL